MMAVARAMPCLVVRLLGGGGCENSTGDCEEVMLLDATLPLADLVERDPLPEPSPSCCYIQREGEKWHHSCSMESWDL